MHVCAFSHAGLKPTYCLNKNFVYDGLFRDISKLYRAENSHIYAQSNTPMLISKQTYEMYFLIQTKLFIEKLSFHTITNDMHINVVFGDILANPRARTKRDFWIEGGNRTIRNRINLM